MIAKQPGDVVRTHLHAPWLIQLVGICRQAAAFAKECEVQSPSKHAFVGAKPAETFFGGNGQSLVRHRTLGWPEARRFRAEDALVVFAGAPQLLACVFGMAV